MLVSVIASRLFVAIKDCSPSTDPPFLRVSPRNWKALCEECVVRRNEINSDPPSQPLTSLLILFIAAEYVFSTDSNGSSSTENCFGLLQIFCPSGQSQSPRQLLTKGCSVGTRKPMFLTSGWDKPTVPLLDQDETCSL